MRLKPHLRSMPQKPHAAAIARRARTDNGLRPGSAQEERDHGLAVARSEQSYARALVDEALEVCFRVLDNGPSRRCTIIDYSQYFNWL